MYKCCDSDWVKEDVETALTWLRNQQISSRCQGSDLKINCHHQGGELTPLPKVKRAEACVLVTVMEGIQVTQKKPVNHILNDIHHPLKEFTDDLLVARMRFG